MIAIDTAMDDVDLAPKAVLALAVQLAAAKVTDADHEGRFFDLFAQPRVLLAFLVDYLMWGFLEKIIV